MGSLDIRQMYPMIPVEKTLKITKEQLIKDDTLRDRMEWKPEHIIELLEVCLETHFQTNEGIVYTQTDGTPIGKSISGPLAGIFVAWFENMFVMKGKFKARIVFWRRMKDDIFFVWKLSKRISPEDFKS